MDWTVDRSGQARTIKVKVKTDQYKVTTGSSRSEQDRSDLTAILVAMQKS